MQLKPEHAKLAAYFNLDNGTGRIRGVWMQSNLAVRPIFEQWIAPLKDLGVTILGPRSVSQTDHVSFDNAGLPGFQFVQDRLEYNARSHHSNMDTAIACSATTSCNRPPLPPPCSPTTPRCATRCCRAGAARSAARGPQFGQD
jgi:hypothetical protein